MPRREADVWEPIREHIIAHTPMLSPGERQAVVRAVETLIEVSLFSVYELRREHMNDAWDIALTVVEVLKRHGHRDSGQSRGELPIPADECGSGLRPY